MQKITLLGATGSIGGSTLGVIDANHEDMCLHAAAARQNWQRMLEIILKYHPEHAALQNEQAAQRLRLELKDAGVACEILSGDAGVAEIAGDGEAQHVVAAIVGASGLKPALAAVRSGVTVDLANKEALVMTGKIFFAEAARSKARVIPVDSEHSAIFQCLPEKEQLKLGHCDLAAAGVAKILLTGSGGPFRTWPLDQLPKVTAAQALHHPVWKMGRKISVDSATMMNKGLEFIEARYLFNARDEDIEIVIHPQSVVHSMVAYADGAVMAQLGTPDMKTPIARALGFPGRIAAGIKPLDLFSLNQLTFEKPDFNRYPCLRLAMQASREGQGATTALNAANEEAVAAFLDGKCAFTRIYSVCAQVLDQLASSQAAGLEEVLAVDLAARKSAQRLLKD